MMPTSVLDLSSVAFNSLFGIPHDELALKHLIPYAFQLPFRDSVLCSCGSGSALCDLSTPFSGFGNLTAPVRAVGSDFQLPFRDSEIS